MIKKRNFILFEVDNNQLQNKDIIDFAPFAHYDEPCIIEFKDIINWYRDSYFIYGTWQYPIIANNKLFVIDGTNRFRYMLICLKNNLNFIKEKHLVYVLEENE